MIMISSGWAAAVNLASSTGQHLFSSHPNLVLLCLLVKLCSSSSVVLLLLLLRSRVKLRLCGIITGLAPSSFAFGIMVVWSQRVIYQRMIVSVPTYNNLVWESDDRHWCVKFDTSNLVDHKCMYIVTHDDHSDPNLIDRWEDIDAVVMFYKEHRCIYPSSDAIIMG